MVRPSNQRSSSEDRRSVTSQRVNRSTTQTAAPSIGSVKITRTEDFHHAPTSTLTTTTTTTRSKSQTRGRPYGDSVNVRTSTSDVDYRPKRSGSSSRQVGYDSNNGRPHHDMFVVGYATVTTQQRPTGSEGVNYQVHLDQQKRARTTVKATPTPIKSSVTGSSSRYTADIDDDYITPLHSTYNRYQTTRSSVSPSSYTAAPRGRSYHTATSVSRSSRPSRSASLPRLDRSTIGLTPSYYTPSTHVEAWRPITSNGPTSTSVDYKLNGWNTKTTGSASGRRSRDVTDRLGDKELYERLRARHVQPATSLLDLSDYEPRRRSTVSHHSSTSKSGYGLPDVMYTSNKIDRGLIADRPVYVQRTASADYPSRYGGFEPTDVNVVVLPNGQRAVTYTKHSQTGRGDHQLANVEIEKIIRRTKPLQDSLHTLEEFVKRNRSLFPENIIIYQNIKFFLLNEEELRRIGERPDAQVYGVKIRERLVVPYGTEIVDILRRHYSKHREVEVEYEDVNRIRVLAKEAEAPQADNHLQTRDSIRRIVETEYEDREASSRTPRRQPHHQATIDYQALKTLEAVKATPLPSTLEFEHEVVNSKRELQRLQTRTKDLLAMGKAFESHDTGSPATSLEFTSKLRNRRIAEGNSVRLSCAINVATDVTVTWYHGPNVVKEGGNHHLSQFYGLCSLDIGKVGKSDAGVYTVTATNVRGSVSCSAALEVDALEAAGDPLELNKPSFVNELESQVVEVGDKVVFKVQFTGHPAPVIQWLRDGLEVQEDSKTQVVTDNNGSSRLTIRDARQSDAGLYCCVAKNKHGVSKCAANLRFKDTKGSSRQFAEYDKLQHTRRTEEDAGDQSGSRPQFMAVPQTQIHVHEGEPLTLRCIVTGRPKPTVTWFRGVRELTYTQRYRILAEKDGHFMMQIPSTMQQTDSGEFNIVASNPNGSVKFTMFITVLPPRPDAPAPVIGTVIDWSDVEEYKRSETDLSPAAPRAEEPEVVQVTAVDQHAPEEQTIELVAVEDDVATEQSSTGVESAPVEESAPAAAAAAEQQETIDAVKEEPTEKPVEAAAVAPVEKNVAVDEVVEAVVLDKQERIPKLQSSPLLQEFADASPVEKVQDEPEEELFVVAEVPKQESEPVPVEPLKEVSEASVERVEKPKQENIKLFDETDAKTDTPTEEVAEEPKEKGKKKKRKDEKVADEPEATKEEKEPTEEAAEEPKEKGKKKKKKDVDAPIDEFDVTKEDKEPVAEVPEELKESGKKKKRKDDKNAEAEVLESPVAPTEETSEEPKEKGKKKKRKDDEVSDEVVEGKEAPSEESPEEPKEKSKKKKSKEDKKPEEVGDDVPVIDEIQEVIVTKQERIPKLESIPLLKDFTDAPLPEKSPEVVEEEELVMFEIPKAESAPVKAEPVEEAVEAPVERVEKLKQELNIFDELAVADEAEKPKEAANDEAPAEIVAVPEEPAKVDTVESKKEKPAATEGEEESEEEEEEEEEDEEEESEEEEGEEKDKKVPSEEAAPADTPKEAPSDNIAPVQIEEVDKVDAKPVEVPAEVSQEDQKVDEEKAPVEENAPAEKTEKEKAQPKEGEEDDEEESEEEEEESEAEEEVEEKDKKAPTEEAAPADTQKGAPSDNIAPVQIEEVDKVDTKPVEVPAEVSKEDQKVDEEKAPVEEKAPTEKTEREKTQPKEEDEEDEEEEDSEEESEEEEAAEEKTEGANKTVVQATEVTKTEESSLTTLKTEVVTVHEKTEEIRTEVVEMKAETVETEVQDKTSQQEVATKSEAVEIKVDERTAQQDVAITSATKGEEKTTQQVDVEEQEESEEEESEEEEEDEEEEEEDDDGKAAGEAPKFSTPLKSESIAVGGDATFACSVTGSPAPTVEWYRGDVLLNASDRYVISVVDGQYSLRIANITEEDAGKYTAKVSNARGICRCTATLAIKGEAPSFSTLLKSECIAAGESATFVCSVAGKPAPTVEWYKGDVLLTGNDRYVISVADGQYSLKIVNVEADDAGQYTAKVSNTSGICRCTATLALQGMTAPKFQQFLQSVLAAVDSDATFTCQITAEPAPTITWSKGDVVLANSEKVEVESEGSQYSLIFKKLGLEDGGQYTIKAQNEVGETSCTATLLVHDGDEDEYEIVTTEQEGEAPKFSTPLKSESIAVGGDATFACSVTGSPAPTVEWYRGDVLLNASDRYVISVVDGQYSLRIVNITEEDAGKYTAKVSNARGICRCTATLAIKGEAPSFSTLLKSECIAAGESATFVCSVAGKPAPTIEWYKGDVLLTGNDRYVISVADGQYSLKIVNVGADDAGQYTAKVSNTSGICRCTATLALQETEQGTTSRVVKETKTTVISSSSAEGMTAPKFQQFLQSVLAAVDSDATFTCQITAEPAPTITWSKGDVVLANSERVEVKSEGSQYSLTLKKLGLEDGGQYTIKAQNEVGETSCTATLLVHDGDEDEYEIVTTEQQDMSMPSFTQFLKSQVVKQGATATLQCILDCQPNPPKIAWLFGGQPVSENDNVKIAADDVNRTYSLTVQSVSADNEGEYTVTASTDCAEISSAATIVIQPEAQVTVKTTTIVEKSATPGSADAAAGGLGFTNYLQSQVVKVNGIAIFACQVKSDTPPQVTWFKDGTELSNSDKVSITPAGDKYCLTILNAQKTDGGEYKVVVSTPTGRLSCTATLLVTDENVTIIRKEAAEESGSEYESDEEEESEESEEE